jgi:polyisoprenoid-binding protein YceI
LIAFQAGLAVKHMVLTTVHGRFTEFSSTLELDEDDLAQSFVKVTINAASATLEMLHVTRTSEAQLFLMRRNILRLHLPAVW